MDTEYRNVLFPNAEFKTLKFPNTPKGQIKKAKDIQQEEKDGWVVVAETITEGEFKFMQAACCYAICWPLVAFVGDSKGTINVTMKRDNGPRLTVSAEV